MDKELITFLEQYNRLYYLHAKKYTGFSCLCTLEDLVQEMKFVTVKHWHKFDPSKGYSRSAYIFKIANNHVIRFIQRELKRKIDIYSPADNLMKDIHFNSISTKSDFTEALMDKYVILDKLAADKKKSEKSKAYQAIKMLIEGATRKEVAEELGTNISYINKIVGHYKKEVKRWN